MQQAALNLIAIGIFVMSMSILAGPWIHLSPAIPAIATAGILGLATLDTLSWQGRGSTLLLDWVASADPEHRDRITRHEAGHFLIAYLLGIPITGYTLTAWDAFKNGQPGLGGVICDTQELTRKAMLSGEGRLILDRFCTVWMAGIAAETLNYDKAQGGGDDRQKIKEAFLILGRPAQEYPTKINWALLQAKTLIQKNWTAYESLVEAMKEGQSVEDCCQVLGLALPQNE